MSDIIFSTTDPEKRELHADTWSHIRERHPEVTKQGVQRIQNTIKNPDFITEQETTSAFLYSRIERSDLFFNVITKQAAQTKSIGVVKTAHLTDRPPKGDVIWLKSST
jgi:hypothetical protein